MIPVVILHRAAEAISTAIFAAFLLITPLRLIRESLVPEVAASVGLWCAYLAVDMLYMAVYTEPRYLAPVVAGSLVVGAANLAWLIARWRAKAGSSRSKTAPDAV